MNKLSKKQKAVICSVAVGLVLTAAVSVGIIHRHNLPVNNQPAQNSTLEQTISDRGEQTSKGVTETTADITTTTTTTSTTVVSSTEKVTKADAVSATKVKKKKPSAKTPEKTTQNSKKVVLNVPFVSQIPKYPTGCEGASATMLLQYYGYKVTLDEMIKAIPREDFYRENGKLYGPSVYKKFAGDPTKTYTDEFPGYVAFSPVITGALNSVIAEKGGKHTAKNITGCTFSELISQLDRKNPIVVWATSRMNNSGIMHSWYIKNPDGSEEYFEYPKSTHVMVLSGYDSKYVYITDPYYGKLKFTRSAFKDKWNLLGRQAIVLERRK